MLRMPTRVKATFSKDGVSLEWNSCRECPRYYKNDGKCHGETKPGACTFRWKPSTGPRGPA